MGLMGGLLGIGGSVVMIPAFTLFFGVNQHLYQAAAMICNFFVALSSAAAHWRARSFRFDILRWLVPGACLAVTAGVAISNLEFFEGDKSYRLTRVFGVFLFYVAGFNVYKFRQYCKGRGGESGDEFANDGSRGVKSFVTGGVTGVLSGLLGIGAGTVATPMQQLLMRVELRSAMSNSSATIVFMALIGAYFKNSSLGEHGVSVFESLKIAGVVIPAAIAGGFVGGSLMHKLDKRFVWSVFIGLLLLAGLRMVTAGPVG